MNASEFFKYIKNEIGNGQIQKALRELENFCEKNNSEFHNDVILQRSAINSANNAQESGLIDFGEWNKERTAVTRSSLSILEKLKREFQGKEIIQSVEKRTVIDFSKFILNIKIKTKLPNRNPDFIGRQKEIKKYLKKLLQGGKLAITGLGGIGRLGQNRYYQGNLPLAITKLQ